VSICKGKHSVSKGARGARGVRSLRTEWPSMAGVAACGAVRPRARLLQQGPAPPPRRARPHAPPLHRPCPEGTVRSRRLPTHGTRTARSAWPQLTAHTRLRLIFTVTMLSPEAVEKHAACKRQRLTVRISFFLSKGRGKSACLCEPRNNCSRRVRTLLHASCYQLYKGTPATVVLIIYLLYTT